MRTRIVLLCFLALSGVFSATLYRNGNVDNTGTDYGLLPTNAPNVGDVLMVTGSGTTWISLTNLLNGVGSVATNPPAVSIATTGWTNIFSKTAIVYFDGTGIIYKVKNNAGTLIYTNTTALLGGSVILQPRGAVTISGTSVKGRATVF